MPKNETICHNFFEDDSKKEIINNPQTNCPYRIPNIKVETPLEDRLKQIESTNKQPPVNPTKVENKKSDEDMKVWELIYLAPLYIAYEAY